MSFLVYKSSAGSGKTFTLVKEYLKLALGSKDPMVFSKILAITFTNKAANEMTDRILETLEEMSGVVTPMQDRTKNLMDLLKVELNLSDSELTERSRKTLKKIVHNYRDFSVGTIDSFVHRIIRSFATEMGLNQQFEVELNAESVLKRGVDLMLERVGVDKTLTKFIELYIDNKFDGGKTWKIDDDLFGYAKALLNTHEWKYLDQAKEISLEEYATKYDLLKKSVQSYEKKLVTIAEKAVDYGLDGVVKSDYSGGGIIINHFDKILKGNFTEEVKKTVRELVAVESSKKWYAGKAKPSAQSIIETKKEELINFFNEIEEERTENEAKYKFEKLVFDNIYKVALLSEIDKETQKIKQANDLVLISDFTNLVGEITRNEPVPFIYEKLGERYSHFMFDEFQDTSLMQWHNMLPLVENSLSQGGTSMVVGDAKQSIYRWRGGVAEQFAKLPQVFNPYNDTYVSEREISLVNSFKDPGTLAKNFRSNANIVNFNNHFFKQAEDVFTESIESFYSDVEQEVKDKDSGGVVQFKFYREKVKSESTELIFNDLVSLIKEIEGDGYNLKDIAVLTKVKKNTPALVEHLAENDIEVISSESLLVNNSALVKLLVSTLRYLSSPNERFYMTELMIRINDIQSKQDFHSKINLGKEITTQEFEKVLSNWGYNLDRNQILALPLYEMVSEILEVFGLTNTTDARFATWMDYVYTLSSQSGIGLFDLLDDWNLQSDKLSIQIPEDVNAVNVLTIHKSKGLDWPVVIVAEGNWPKYNKSHSIWVDVPEEDPIPVIKLPYSPKLEGTVFEKFKTDEDRKIILDNLNTMYVAFTRPSERLYVMGINPEKEFFESLVSILDGMHAHPLVEMVTETAKKGEVISKFRYGLPKPKELDENKEISKPKLIKIANHKNNFYREKLKVKKNYIKWLSSAGERDFGTLVHKAFSFIDTQDDISDAVEKLLKIGDIAEEEKLEFTNLLTTVITDTKIAPYFKAGLEVKNEAEIVLENGDLLRPDRVVIEKNQATVIDFKTGMRKPSHDQQVLGYKIQLEKLGYENVKSILIYTADLEVVEV